jgi:hypothetical protein
MIPRNGPIVIIINSHIEEHVKDEGKTEKGKIESITFFSHPVLHAHFNAEKPERLNQQIQDDEQKQVGDKALFQSRAIKNIFKLLTNVISSLQNNCRAP